MGIQLPLGAILHQNLRGLGQAGQQFVGRLGGEYQRVVRAWTTGADGVHIVIELMEGRVGQPCFVKVQGVDGRVENIFNFFDVVHNAVVGTLGNRQYARFFVFGVTCKGVVFNFFANCRGVKFTFRYWADNAVMIARGH